MYSKCNNTYHRKIKMKLIEVKIQGWAKKEPIKILCHNSAVRCATALNFGRNTTSIAFN